MATPSSAPLERQAARVLLVDGQGRVLLFRGHDFARPEAGSWWFTVGGGLDEGETPREAAAREMFEETGLAVPPETLTGPLHREYAEFTIDSTDYRQHNEFYAARVDDHDVVTHGFTELESALVLEHRWWSVEELRSTTDTVYPACLVELLDRLEV